MKTTKTIGAWVGAFVALGAATSLQAIYDVSDKGLWPTNWPKELESLRKQSRTLVHAQHCIHEIPFTNRLQFEAAWPYLLAVKTPEAPIILLKGPNQRLGTIRAGVRILAPRTGSMLSPEGAHYPPGVTNMALLRIGPPWPEDLMAKSGALPEFVVYDHGRWAACSLTNRPTNPFSVMRSRTDIELIVDGDIVDLNRLPLPADAPIRDQRSLTAGVADGGSHHADNPKAGAPIDAQKLRLLAWGLPATNGLRAACYFEPTQDTYVDGEVVKRRVVFHNSGMEPVLFTVGLGGNDDGWTVVNEQGRKVPLQHITYSGLVPLRTFRLEPGHATEIDCMSAGMGASARAKHPADTVIQARPGTTCRVRWTLAVAETKRVENGKGVPVAGVWHGTLTTGEVRFRIIGDLGEGGVSR
jgi:hypothetical protein